MSYKGTDFLVYCLDKQWFLDHPQIEELLRRVVDSGRAIGISSLRACRISQPIADLLARAGVDRIMRAGHMSVTFCGEAHDGEYPLRRYMRVVNIED